MSLINLASPFLPTDASYNSSFHDLWLVLTHLESTGDPFSVRPETKTDALPPTSTPETHTILQPPPPKASPGLSIGMSEPWVYTTMSYRCAYTLELVSKSCCRLSLGTAPTMADPSLPPSPECAPISGSESAPLDPLRERIRPTASGEFENQRNNVWFRGGQKIRNIPTLESNPLVPPSVHELGSSCIVVNFSPSTSDIWVSLSLILRDCYYDARCSKNPQVSGPRYDVNYPCE